MKPIKYKTERLKSQILEKTKIQYPIKIKIKRQLSRGELAE